MGILFLREREETHEWLGLFLSLTGISMVVLSPQLNHANGPIPPQAMLGNLLVIGTNIIATLNTFFVKKVYRKLSKPLISSVNVIFGTFLFILLNLVTTGPLPLHSLAIPAVLFAVMYMAFFGTMLATSLELYGYNLIEASEASLFQYLEPLIYVPLAILWLQEPISPFQLGGLATILIGVTLAAIRLPRRHHRLGLFHGGLVSKQQKLAEFSTITQYQRVH
jgi:drug/metabolite transporter (DMT)-like permease